MIPLSVLERVALHWFGHIGMDGYMTVWLASRTTDRLSMTLSGHKYSQVLPQFSFTMNFLYALCKLRVPASSLCKKVISEQVLAILFSRRFFISFCKSFWRFFETSLSNNNIIIPCLGILSGATGKWPMEVVGRSIIL